MCYWLHCLETIITLEEIPLVDLNRIGSRGLGRHCVIQNCESYKKKSVKASLFSFPLKKEELLNEWESFVASSNLENDKWYANQSSRICDVHFEEEFLCRGEKKIQLRWNLNPIPTKIGKRCCSTKNKGDDIDLIRKFDILNESHASPGFKCGKYSECIVLYHFLLSHNHYIYVYPPVSV